MAEDAYDYASSLPTSRFKRRLQKLEHIQDEPLNAKARPGKRFKTMRAHAPGSRKRRKVGF
jgi:ribosome assembly protein YihI (activator of Der GTPase)